MSNGSGTDCSARTCGFGAFGEVACTNGESCSMARMLAAKESNFHDADLQKASREIQAVLDSIPPDPKGRQLSFLHTQMGTMLAWVRHDIEVPKGAVMASSSNEDVIYALGLIDRPAAAC